MRLDQLKNIGPAMTMALSAAGITTVQQLQAIGSIEAYKRIRETGIKVDITTLYGLEGALRNTRWSYLPHYVRRQLRSAANFF
jgi:DNA transformation protein